MFRRIDQSDSLIKLLNNLSNYFAQRRGLLIILGIVMIALAMVVQIINVLLGSPIIEVIHIILRDVGIIIALIGILLIAPLGN